MEVVFLKNDVSVNTSHHLKNFLVWTFAVCSDSQQAEVCFKMMQIWLIPNIIVDMWDFKLVVFFFSYSPFCVYRKDVEPCGENGF